VSRSALSPEKQASWLTRVSARFLLSVISIYRRYISPLKAPSCRFYPTCSAYAEEAIRRYGPWRGGTLAIRRVARCHPWHPGGHDPVP